VHFAYENGDLITQLKDRGEFIMHERWEENRRITENIRKNVKRNADRYSRPIRAYITFVKDEGKFKALQY